MDEVGTFTLVVIFIVLVVFIAAVVIGIGISNKPTNNANLIVIEQGTFLSACTTVACENGLICDGNSFVCKQPSGVPCSDFTDCANGLICSGLCATGATGGLNQLCPCNPGFICKLQANLLTICKGAGGTPCVNNSDCASGLCLNTSVCATGAPNSFPCNANSDCSSNNCSIGFCQAPGIVSGALGSACAGSCVGFTGAVCNNMIQNPLTCQCIQGTGLAGTCVTATQGILSSCSSFTACGDELVCYTNTGTDCGSAMGCLCTFSYTQPNTVPTGGVCIDGMSPNLLINECFNEDNFGCDNGGMCVNQACGGPGVLMSYQFSTATTPNLRTNFIGATTTTLRMDSFSVGLILPYKMFAVSNGVVDTIYSVDTLQGLLMIQYDPIDRVIITPWTQLIPHQTTTIIGNTTSVKNLIDVGYNSTTFLVAFDELITVTGTGGFIAQNDTVYTGTSVTALTPFNFQPGIGITGTQYTTGNTPLSIDYIDISSQNDVSPGNDALISTAGTIYIKLSTQSKYSIGIIVGGPLNGNSMTGTTGPARFYFDDVENRGTTGTPMCPSNGHNVPIQCQSFQNVAFVGPFQTFGPSGNTGNFLQVLQFSGNIAGLAIPLDRFDDIQYEVFDFSIYSISPIGMPGAGTILLTNAFQGTQLIGPMVAVNFGGSVALLPYRISSTSRCVASANAFYVLSIGSCT